MKLLYCHNRYHTRSGEDVAYDTALHLWRDAGYEVRTFERDNSVLVGGEAKVLWRSALSAVDDGRVGNELLDLIDEWQPDAAIVQNTFPLLSLSPYRVLAQRSVPIVQVVYNYRFLCLNGEFYTGGQICERCASGNYLHGVVRRCYRRSVLASAVAARVAFANRWGKVWETTVARYVVPDRFLGDKLAEYGLPRTRLRVIPNPTLIPLFQVPPQHDGTLLFVGRWTRQKGVLTLLDAALTDGVPPVVLVGAGEEQNAVEAHPAVRRKRARIVGPLYDDALVDLVRKAMAVVVPSQWYDNLPMVVSQAFAHGRPVIASRINGIPEFVRHGVNGMLVPPGDVSALAAAMKEVGRDGDEWRAMALAARDTAERELSGERWLQRWEAVFADLGS